MNCCGYFRIILFRREEALFGNKAGWNDIDGKGNDIREYLVNDNQRWFCKSRADGGCIFWGKDSLCTIQKRLGADSMPSVCRTYPRIITRYPDRIELALDQCCPVVAASVREWNLGDFNTEGSCSDSSSLNINPKIAKRNKALAVLCNQSISFKESLETVAGMYGCDVSVPDFDIDDRLIEYDRKHTALFVWSYLLSHEGLPGIDNIMTLIVKFAILLADWLKNNRFEDNQEMDVAFAKFFIQYGKESGLEPDVEEKFCDSNDI